MKKFLRKLTTWGSRYLNERCGGMFADPVDTRTAPACYPEVIAVSTASNKENIYTHEEENSIIEINGINLYKNDSIPFLDKDFPYISCNILSADYRAYLFDETPSKEEWEKLLHPDAYFKVEDNVKYTEESNLLEVSKTPIVNWSRYPNTILPLTIDKVENGHAYAYYLTSDKTGSYYNYIIIDYNIVEKTLTWSYDLCNVDTYDRHYYLKIKAS